jgi:hypothetical protein
MIRNNKCKKCGGNFIDAYKINGDRLECYAQCEKCLLFYAHLKYESMDISALSLCNDAGEIDTEWAYWIPLKEKENKKEQHQEYLKSTQWKEIRKKVLKRDDYTCQGCLESPAVDVHHITYNNWQNEFMFELMSLCRECHTRVHKKDKQ